MSAEISTPFGVHSARIPDESVVDRIRQILSEAERGEIVGFVWAGVRPNYYVTFGSVNGSADCNVLAGAASHAWFDLMKTISECGS